MPALTGSTFGVLKPPKLPTVTSLTKGFGPPPTNANANASYDLSDVSSSARGGSGGSPAAGSNPFTNPASTASGSSTSTDPYATSNAALSAPPNSDAPSTFSPTWDINNDPLYSQFTNFTLPSLLSQAQGNQQQQTRAALQQFGEIPDLTSAISGLGLNPSSSLYSMIFGDIDQPTRDAAAALTKSGLSTTAGLDKQHATDIQGLLDSMASRGTVQSGGTGVGLGQADQTYNQNEYNARTSLLQYLTGIQSAFNQAQQSAYQQQSQAATDAAQRQISLIPGIGTVSAPGGVV